MAFEYLLNQTRDEMELLNEVCVYVAAHFEDFRESNTYLRLEKTLSEKSTIRDVRRFNSEPASYDYYLRELAGSALVHIYPGKINVYVQLFGFTAEIVNQIESNKFTQYSKQSEVCEKGFSKDFIRSAFAEMQGLLQEP